VAKQEKASQSIGQRLKGNVMLSRKESLEKYENLTVSLMIEFFLGDSDHVKESRKLISSIDEIIQLAKSKWSQK
jgi:hypothetical protein